MWHTALYQCTELLRQEKESKNWVSLDSDNLVSWPFKTTENYFRIMIYSHWCRLQEGNLLCNPLAVNANLHKVSILW
jgi:hypothetical protein